MNAKTKTFLRGGVLTAMRLLKVVGLHPARRLKSLADIAKKVPGTTFEEIIPAKEYDLTPPDYAVNAAGSLYLKYVNGVGTQFRSFSAGMAVLPDARFAFPTGIHGTHGYFPRETSLLHSAFPANHAAAQALNLWRSSAKAVDDGVLLSISLSRNYYHWLIEILPRLALFADDPRYQDLPIYVARDLPRFVHESLAETGIAASRFVELPTGYYSAGRLYVPTMFQRVEWPCPAVNDWIRKTFVPEAPVDGQSNAPARTRLLVSRRDADRRLVNEDALVAALEPLGFQTVVLSGRQFAEQVALFRNAEIVIGSHGAGFTNMAFAPPASALIEIVGNVHVGVCYWLICKLAGRRHGYIVGGDDAQGIVVDVDAAVEVVKKALADVEAMRGQGTMSG